MVEPPINPRNNPNLIPMANPKLYNLGFMLGFSTNRLTKAQLSLETRREKTSETDK